MKWDCSAREKRRAQWHRWFAWYPVEVAKDDCRWLEFIERKIKWHSGTYMGGWWNTEYRA